MNKTDRWGRSAKAARSLFHSGWEAGEISLVRGVWVSRVMCRYQLPGGRLSHATPYPAYAALTGKGTVKTGYESRRELLNSTIQEG